MTVTPTLSFGAFPQYSSARERCLVHQAHEKVP